MTVKTCSQVADCLKQLAPQSLIFIDVDDTLITPCSKAFRVPAHSQIIDDIKRNKERYPHCEIIVSNWRLQRKIQLVDPLWPALIENLKTKHFVFGLTKMDTGRYGVIHSMESWRYEELKKLGIEFSQNPNLSNNKLAKNLSPINKPTFYKGIFFTGSTTKSEVIRLYQDYLLPSCPHLSLIDDRPEQLEDIQKLCDLLNIPFTGIHFSGVSTITDLPDAALMAFQKNYLLENYQWLEDDEAERLIRSST